MATCDAIFRDSKDMVAGLLLTHDEGASARLNLYPG
jgi:hypothetical protein